MVQGGEHITLDPIFLLFIVVYQNVCISTRNGLRKHFPSFDRMSVLLKIATDGSDKSKYNTVLLNLVSTY